MSRCGTTSFYVTYETADGKEKNIQISARGNPDARRIVRNNCGEAVKITKVERVRGR